MKRHQETQPSRSGREKLRRQEPVSCAFCRAKKLKCDRGSPCSNCRARKLICGNETRPDPFFAPAKEDTSSSQAIQEMNQRMKKLEDLITSMNSNNSSTNSSNYVSVTADTNLKTPYSPPRNQPNHEASLYKTASWIESDAFEREIPKGSVPEMTPSQQFGSFVFALTSPQLPSTSRQHLSQILPNRGQAQIMLDYFIDHGNWIYHIFHVPSLRNQFCIFYSQLERGESPEYGHVALFSTLFALCAFFYSPIAGFHFKESEAKTMCTYWKSFAQEALSASNCLAKPTIESLQSLILIAHHLLPNAGVVATIKVMSSLIIFPARGLSLHLVDSPAEIKRRQESPRTVDWVDIEVKRRIWWHIVATDWILCFMSGPPCVSRTYVIHPKQMMTQYPSNVDDVDITSDGNYAKPDQVSTEMTYLRFRIHISTVVREMADAAWDLSRDIDDLPLELVLEFDKKFHNLMSEVDKEHSALEFEIATRGNAVTGSTKAKLHLLSMQRDMIYFGTHTRISRLHRLYLARGARDPKYAYSRMICLQSARTVIEIGRKMLTSDENMVAGKIWCVHHHIFAAAVILVMDYCFNREEPRAKERKEEILESFKILENSRDENTMAIRGMQKLRKLLSGKCGVREGQCMHLSTDTNHTHVAEQAPKPKFMFEQIGTTCPFQLQSEMPASESTRVDSPLGSVFEASAETAWEDFDFAAIDRYNFDSELDASKFDPLFENIDYGDQLF